MASSPRSTVYRIGARLIQDKVEAKNAEQIIIGVEAYLLDRNPQKVIETMVQHLNGVNDGERVSLATHWSKALLDCARYHGKQWRIDMEGTVRNMDLESMTEIPLVSTITRQVAIDMNHLSGLRKEFQVVDEIRDFRQQ